MADLISMLAAAAGASAGGEYQISRSLRFNSADSAYLNRTPASAGNRTVWTFSCWIKRGKLTTAMELLNTYSDSNNQTSIMISATAAGNADTIRVYNYVAGSFVAHKVSTLVLRDPSSWYHLLVAWDTGEAAADRIKIYVNNELITSFTTNINAGTENTFVNATNAHFLSSNNGAGRYFDGYMADVYLIDGQALTPSDFGETDATTGVWKPKAYAGTYGTNGFYLDFSDNSSTTALGYDAAGSNDWTPNNFSVTAGAGNDSLVDTPTPYGTDTGAGGEVRGNYATLNPLVSPVTTLSNGNLSWSQPASAYRYGLGTIAIPSTGKYIVEVLFNSTPTTNLYNTVGVINQSGLAWLNNTFISSGRGLYGINDASSTYGQSFVQDGVRQGSITVPSGTIIQLLIDRDNNELTFTKNGTLQTGTGSTVSIPSDVDLWVIVGDWGSSGSINFGQRPFAYTAPSGFKALCTQNLPTPTVVQGDDYFNTVLWTGTGATNSITGVGFQPDWVWIKQRSGTRQHNVYDAIRGATKELFTDSTDAENTLATGLTSFDSDGFTLGTGTRANESGFTYVGWNWNAGGSNATNTDGTITSTVRANTTAGFSIGTYTGDGSNANRTVGHGLGVAPSMVIVKTRSEAARNWLIWHKDLTAADYALLFTTGAEAGLRFGPNAPTSDVFGVYGGQGNRGTETFVFYAFAEVDGYSRISSYVGNGSTNGPFVYCGFRPAFIMVKRTDTTGQWFIFDDERSTYNVVNKELYPNASTAEATFDKIDFLSNGFKMRTTGVDNNASGGTYIFMAFAENPFKYSLAR